MGAMRLTVLLTIVAAACSSHPEVVVDGGPDANAPDANEGPDAPPDTPPEDGTLTLTPTMAQLGLVQVGEQASTTITLTNPSATGLARIANVTVTGAGFALKSSSCGAVVQPAASCELEIELAPAALQLYTGQLVIESATTSTASLRGTGAWELAVERSGTGGGTFSSSPSGIACGSDCSQLFSGDVELEVMPEPGSTVSAWSLADCTGLRCMVPRSSPERTVTAVFQPAAGRPIYVRRDGSGTITSSPPGIDCGTTCANVIAGEVTLTANPPAGAVFMGWSDPACGTSLTCVIPDGGDRVDLVASFRVGSSLEITMPGDAPGEVSAYHDGELIGRCTSSCSLIVPPAPLLIVATTPNILESVTGAGCAMEFDHCTITPDDGAQITATFRRDPKDRWTFFGRPNERFTTGAFDYAGNLIAISVLRMIKLDPNGQLLWERPDPDDAEVLIGPGNVIYIHDSRGAVKLDPDGHELWVWPATTVSALDAAGNLLLLRTVNGASQMTLVRPDGTPLWSAPGSGTTIDGAGIIYGEFITLEWDEDSGHYHEKLNTHRYGSGGAPLADALYWGSVEEEGHFQFLVTPNHSAVLELDKYDFNMLNVSVRTLATNAPVHVSYVWRIRNDRFPNGFIAGAGDDVGFIHDPSDGLAETFYGYGYVLSHLRADGSYWTVERIPPRDWTLPLTSYGPYVYGLAGGPNGDLAMLGIYRPFERSDPTRPDVGLIQAFAP